MHRVTAKGIRVYAYHGCLPEEELVGGPFLVDVDVDTDFSGATVTDNLAQTVDYETIVNIVSEEMAVRSKLIEQVGQRIVNQIKARFSPVERVEVTIKKLEAPLSGELEYVGITIVE